MMRLPSVNVRADADEHFWRESTYTADNFGRILSVDLIIIIIIAFTTVGACVFPPTSLKKKRFLFIYFILNWTWSSALHFSPISEVKTGGQRGRRKGIRFFAPFLIIVFDLFLFLFFIFDWGHSSSHRNVHESRCLPPVVLETPEQTGFDVRTSRRRIPNLMHIFEHGFFLFH